MRGGSAPRAPRHPEGTRTVPVPQTPSQVRIVAQRCDRVMPLPYEEAKTALHTPGHARKAVNVTSYAVGVFSPLPLPPPRGAGRGNFLCWCAAGYPLGAAQRTSNLIPPAPRRGAGGKGGEGAPPRKSCE